MLTGEENPPKANAREGAGTVFLRLLHDTRGFTAVFLALIISVLIGFSALGVETGLWYAIKRQNQSGADVAALSGAMEKAGSQGYPDICGFAKFAAQANNFTVDAGWSCPGSSPANQSDCTSLTSGQMCVNNPPLFGAYAGASFPKHVEVILAQQQSGFLASLWQANVMIDTRAVAGPKTFDTCMIALNTSGTDLKNNGTTTLKLNNCSFISNSTSLTNPNYSLEFNGNILMQAGAIQTAGGTNITGNSNYISPPVTQAPGVTDPYAGNINPPTNTSSDVCGAYAAGSHTLAPGWYGGCSSSNDAPIHLSGSSNTVFCPGVYFLDGQDSNARAFRIEDNLAVVSMGTAGGSTPSGVTCPSNGMDGVTIIATCRTAGCTSGGGFEIGFNTTPHVNLSAPTTNNPSGCTTGSNPCIPQRILFYQPASTADTSGGQKGDSTIAGGVDVHLDGVIYTPATQITLQGNPDLGSCTEMIAANFVVGGNPTMNAPLSSCGIITRSASTLVLVE
jgi:hypothetical protein